MRRFERFLLDGVLKGDGGKHVAAEVFFVYRNGDGGVCVLPVAGVKAHAVGDDRAALGSRGDDRSAGTHAEGIDRAVAVKAVRKGVFAVRQGGMSRFFAVEGAVNVGLQMLDANAHRKGLGAERDSF